MHLKVLGFIALFFSNIGFSQVNSICNESVNGAQWTLIGPNKLPEKGPGARFSQLGTGAQMRAYFRDVDKEKPQELYVCTPSSGLFRTKNVWAATPEWENLTDNTRLPVQGVRDVAFVPEDDQTIYVGTGLRYPLELRRLYGIGILKSIDNGTSWQTTGLTFKPPGKREQVCHDLLVNPDNPQIIHALCGQHYYRSEDAGETFNLKKKHELKSPAGWGASFRDIMFKPDDPNVIYLTTDHNFIHVSNDGGDTWNSFDVMELGVKEPTKRMDVAVTPTEPDLVYIACATKKGASILRSIDAGINWEIVFEKRIRTSYERNDFVISPNDKNILYIGGLYIDRIVIDSTSSNGRSISSGTHLDHRGLTVISDENGRDILFSANDGGLYMGRLKEGKKKWEWTDISGVGMNNTQFYGIGVAEDLSVVLGGTQDNGVLVGDTTGRFVKPRLGGDGADCAVDRFDSERVYGTKWDLVPPQVWRSIDKGQVFKKHIKKGIEDKADTYYSPLEAGEDGYLYFGTRNVFKLPLGGEEWEQVGDIQLPTNLPYRLLSLAICSSDPNVIYAIGDLLYKTTNATAENPVWRRISDGMGEASKPYGAGGEMSAVTMDPLDSERVWVSIRNYDKTNKVYYSANGGGEWITVSSGLPPYPINDIMFQAGTKDAVYVATDVGVFYNQNASDPNSTWECFNAGLPICMVTDIEMNYCFGKIVIGTFGRGIWSAPFANPSDFVPVSIKKDTKWQHKIVRSDIVVEKKATLELSGEIRIATGQKILLKKNSQLVLKDAHISGLCGTEWEGILMEERGNFIQRIFGARTGELIIEGDVSIEDAALAVPE